MKSRYIYKDVLLDLIDANILKLCPEQKKVIANMISLQVGREFPLVPAGVVPIPKRLLRVINVDPTIKEKRVLSLSLLHKERSCGFIAISSKASSELL